MIYKFTLFLAFFISSSPILAQQSQCRTTLPPNYDSTKNYPVIFLLPSMGGGYPSIPNEVNGRSFIISEVQGTESLVGGFDKTIERGEKAIFPELTKLKAKYLIDTNNILLVGFSLGGDVAFAIALKYPQMFSGVFIMSSRSTFRTKPETIKGNAMKFFFTVGGNDLRKKDIEQARVFLTKAGISSNMEVVPKMSHMPPPDNYVIKGLNFLLK